MQKYGIIGAGFLLVFASFLYFIKVGMDEGWVQNWILVFLGLGLGAGAFSGAYVLYQRGKKVLAEILGGFGAAMVYGSLIYAKVIGFWDDVTVLLSLMVLTVWITYICFQFNLRILTALAFAGGLFTPFAVHLNSATLLLLFIYVFSLNGVVLFLSVAKKWKELPFIALGLTAILYLTYYLTIRPENWWEPFGYVTAFFVLYGVVTLVLALRAGSKFQGSNLVVSALNALWYGIWSVYIFHAFSLDTTVAVLILALMCIGLSSAVLFLFPESRLTAYIYFTVGTFLCAVSVGGWAKWVGDPLYIPLIQVFVWSLICGGLFITGINQKNRVFLNAALGGWIFTFLFWTAMAWTKLPMDWFGLPYVPFINPPALVWILLIALGFLSSRVQGENGKKLMELTDSGEIFSRVLTNIVTVLSHISLALLLTLQVYYLWDYYVLDTWGDESLFFSLTWGVYALVLFLWGYKKQSKAYLFVGDGVIAVVLIKVLFFDMSGKPSLATAITIFATGILVLGIGYLNYRWQSKRLKHKDSQNQE